MKKFMQAIANLTLILLCLIAFVPREAFSPELVEALKQIYFQKPPGTECLGIGCKGPVVKVSEIGGGLIRIEIDQPKQEI